jgi:hypothetical protein
MSFVVAYIAAVLTLNLAGLLTFNAIVEEVNQRRPESERVWSVWVINRPWEFLGLHRRFYPGSYKRIAYYIAIVLFVLCFFLPLVAMWSFAVRHS